MPPRPRANDGGAEDAPFVRQKRLTVEGTVLPCESQGFPETVGNVREVPSFPARLQQQGPEIEVPGPELPEPAGGDARHQIAVRVVAAVDHHADVAAADRVPPLENLGPIVMDQGGGMADHLILLPKNVSRRYRCRHRFTMHDMNGRWRHMSYAERKNRLFPHARIQRASTFPRWRKVTPARRNFSGMLIPDMESDMLGKRFDEARIVNDHSAKE